VEALQACDIDGGCVNAGGDLRLFGPNTETVHVRHPQAPTHVLPLAELRNGAAATSSGYFAARWHAGQAVSPHIDPRSGKALATGGSATVLAADCMTADALTKIVLADWQAALPVLDGFAARAIVLDRDANTGAWRMSETTTPEQRRA
jgi:thiamine biosynthesis lipoprotein